jgi:hypothetical protein
MVTSSSPSTGLWASKRCQNTGSYIGCTIFATFFLFASKRIKSNMDLIHIHMFRYIHKPFIRFKIFKYSKYKALKRIFESTISHTGEYSFQNIRFVEAKIGKPHFQANIRFQIFAYKRIFATFCFKQFNWNGINFVFSLNLGF